MDGENTPDHEIAAAMAVGASVFEQYWSTVVPGIIAVVWSGLADGVVSCYDCYPMMGCPALFSKFETLGWPVFHGRPLSNFVCFSFIRPVHREAHTEKNDKNNCRGNQKYFVFYFCTFWSHSGWS